MRFGPGLLAFAGLMAGLVAGIMLQQTFDHLHGTYRQVDYTSKADKLHAASQ